MNERDRKQIWPDHADAEKALVVSRIAVMRTLFNMIGSPVPEIYQAIRELPAAEAEEREPAEWMYTDAWPARVYCSRCSRTFAQAHWEIWKDGSLPRNFCPSCGARMQMGTKEEEAL